MIDGGNATFFQTMNNVIDNCGGLRRWFEGVATRYAAKVIPVARTKSAPLPYLSRAILDDLENYRIYVTGGMPEEVEDDYGAPETPDIVETTDFVETDASRSTSWCRRMPRRRKKSRRRCCATLTATCSRPG